MYELEQGIRISEGFTCRKFRFLGMEEWLHISFSVIVQYPSPRQFFYYGVQKAVRVLSHLFRAGQVRQ
jgi:hypothetical protein